MSITRYSQSDLFGLEKFKMAANMASFLKYYVYNAYNQAANMIMLYGFKVSVQNVHSFYVSIPGYSKSDLFALENFKMAAKIKIFHETTLHVIV